MIRSVNPNPTLCLSTQPSWVLRFLDPFWVPVCEPSGCLIPNHPCVLNSRPCPHPPLWLCLRDFPSPCPSSAPGLNPDFLYPLLSWSPLVLDALGGNPSRISIPPHRTPHPHVLGAPSNPFHICAFQLRPPTLKTIYDLDAPSALGSLCPLKPLYLQTEVLQFHILGMLPAPATLVPLAAPQTPRPCALCASTPTFDADA